MNPCPQCGMLDQVRGVRAILRNDVWHSSSVGAVQMRGYSSGSGSTRMAGSLHQYGTVRSPIAAILGNVVFLDPRHAGVTRHRASIPSLISAYAITLLSVPVVLVSLGPGFLHTLGALCIAFIVGVIAISPTKFVTSRLDRSTTAADLPKQHGRQLARQRGALFETLSYCGRDHLAYDPRSGAHFPPEGITGYLFHQIPEGEYVAQTDRSGRH